MSYNKIFIFTFTFLLLILLISGSVLFFTNNQFTQKNITTQLNNRIFKSKKNKPNKSKKVIMQKWAKAVKENNKKHAIQKAREAIARYGKAGDSVNVTIDNYIHNSIRKNRDSVESFLSSPLNKKDYFYWKSAFYFHKKAKNITKNKDRPIRAIYNYVNNKFDNGESNTNKSLWPVIIDRQEQAFCDRQGWLACKLAYHRGYETQIIYFYNMKQGKSPHSTCTVRKNGKAWVVDPHADVFTNESIERLVKESKNMWSNINISTMKNVQFFTPSYPQAYRPANQILADLAQSTLDNPPRFGEPPNQRRGKYVKLADDNAIKSPHPYYGPAYPRYALWFYPFRLTPNASYFN